MSLSLAMEPKQLNKRVSFFPNGLISYDGVTITSLSNLLNKYGLLPTLNNSVSFQIGPSGLISPKEVKTLEMRSLQNSMRVSMLPERIDVFSADDIDIKVLIEKANKIANDIISVCSNIFNRIALGSVFFFEVSNDKIQSVYSSIVKNSLEENPIEWSLRKVNRKSISQETHQVWYNEVHTISRSVIPISHPQQLNGITLEFDVNTVVGSVPDDIMAIKEIFFKQALDVIETNISEYQKQLHTNESADQQ